MTERAPARFALVAAFVFLCLACGGAPDPQAVSPTGSPDFQTMQTHAYGDLEIPIGSGTAENLPSNGSLKVGYDDERDMDAEIARYDAWAKSEGWEPAWSNRTPFEKQYVYRRAGRRLVLTFHALGPGGTVLINEIED